MSKNEIVRVDPPAAIPGGEVAVECDGYDTSKLRECRAEVGGVEARLVGAAPWRVLATVPETHEGGEDEVVLFAADGRTVRCSFLLSRCVPVKLKAPALNAKDGMVAVEELQLAYESLTLRRPS